ncbi:hypothetical protein PLICRDRAFT_373814 [Plicaturopsis crispa FD-325 SS-3]|uniref:Uncharacterized protein n=1 Tax=Plicaturopsis crispa FD-325 SS-3 TaxID=944288 RepID=A0A0C9T4H1_PLICR|nr:hypothetical protein PLICRDRAFT_373814 [Plicaturopsis crispa FD-325 SS-3]
MRRRASDVRRGRRCATGKRTFSKELPAFIPNGPTGMACPTWTWTRHTHDVAHPATGYASTCAQATRTSYAEDIAPRSAESSRRHRRYIQTTGPTRTRPSRTQTHRPGAAGRPSPSMRRSCIRVCARRSPCPAAQRATRTRSTRPDTTRSTDLARALGGTRKIWTLATR